MRKNGDQYRICLSGDTPVGFVGSVSGDIRVATHPEYHGKGIAKFMIQEIIKEYPNSTAKIKIHNEASIRAFEKAGFVKKYYLLEPQ
jgi:RimJ/RimL family protein N-acetyltransferase